MTMNKRGGKKRNGKSMRKRKGGSNVGMLSGMLKQLAVPATLLYAQKRVHNKSKGKKSRHSKRSRSRSRRV